MKKIIVRSLYYAVLVAHLIYFISACTKSDVEQEDYLNSLATETADGLEIRSRSFNHGCFELVFPVNIKMPDGMIRIAENQDTLKKLLKGYCMSATDVPKPELVFPIEIKAQDGTLMKVESKDALRALKDECFKNMLDSLRHRERGEKSNDSLCFRLVYPVQVQKPDGTIVKVASKEDLKALIKNEARISHRRKGRLVLVFPVEVTLSDGSSKILNSEDELKMLKRSCDDN